jgi:hypothetical protein
MLIRPSRSGDAVKNLIEYSMDEIADLISIINTYYKNTISVTPAIRTRYELFFNSFCHIALIRGDPVKIISNNQQCTPFF